MKKYFLKTALILAFLLIASNFSAFADSPVTESDISKAYMDNKIVKEASDLGKINEEIAQYLFSPDNPLEIKAAVINALSWDFNGKNNAELYAETAYKKSIKDLDLNSLSYDQIFCIGYLKLMDDYFSPEKTLYYLEKSKLKQPDSYTVNMILGIAKAQALSDEVWEQVKDIFDNETLNKDKLNDEAVNIIYEYMSLYKEDEVKRSINLDYSYKDNGIVLQWTADTGSDVDGYNIFKTTDRANGAFVCINKELIKDNKFFDNDIVDGQPYYYFVQSVLKDGSKKDDSNTIIAPGISDIVKVNAEGTNNQTVNNTTSLNTEEQEVVYPEVMLKIGYNYITVDGKKIKLSSNKKIVPVKVKGNYYIPVDAFVKAIGGKVSWKNSEKKMTIKYKGNTVELWLNKNKMSVNGKMKSISPMPQNINSVFMAPVFPLFNVLNLTAIIEV